MSLAVVCGVEDTPSRMLEIQSKIFSEDFHKHSNKDATLYMVQPTTDRPVSEDTVKHYQKHDTVFVNGKVSNPQRYRTRYLNKCLIGHHVSSIVGEEYMMVSDSDIMILGDFQSDLPKDDNVTVSFFKDDSTHTFEFKKQSDILYKNVMNTYGINGIDVDVFSWCVYAKTSHSFWKEFNDLTLQLLIELHHIIDNDLLSDEDTLKVLEYYYNNNYTEELISDILENKSKYLLKLESSIPEIAIGILYTVNPEGFNNLFDYKGFTASKNNDNYDMMLSDINNNSTYHHYRDFKNMDKFIMASKPHTMLFLKHSKELKIDIAKYILKLRKKKR